MKYYKKEIAETVFIILFFILTRWTPVPRPQQTRL